VAVDWKIQYPIPRYRHRTFAEGKQERVQRMTDNQFYIDKLQAKIKELEEALLLKSPREVALERAAQMFIDRVDAGEVRSNTTYMAFKRALKGEL
jgi:hypothetical protein